jgi:hypothetical protein
VSSIADEIEAPLADPVARARRRAGPPATVARDPESYFTKKSEIVEGLRQAAVNQFRSELA